MSVFSQECLDLHRELIVQITHRSESYLYVTLIYGRMASIECDTSVSLQQSQKQNIDLTRQAKFASTPAFALFVTLKNVVCKIGEDAEVLMSLYDPVESKFIR